MKANKLNLTGIISLLISVVLFVAAVWLFVYRQYAVDQFAVWQYQPTAEIEQVAKEAGFSDEGLFYFYASHPVIDGTSNFNVECAKQEAGSAILGCYVHNNIFIYDITDPRLKGVKAVTAAHEMLHAAYARLSGEEKSQVDRLLDEAYQEIEDENLDGRMQYYARTQPGQKHNELHSIIPTEILELSPELESYYGRYFNDRVSLVKLHDSYSSQFKKRIEKRKQIGQQMEKLAKEIEAATQQYNQGVADLNGDVANFNQNAMQGQFRSQYQFNQQRNSLLQRSANLSAIRDEINTNIKQYEKLRLQYNKLVDESNGLQKSIDSTLAPPPEEV